MATVTSWIKAARPRTLPLAFSGVLMGNGLALFYEALQVSVAVLAIVTATLIQMFSNFANDYGDSLRHTDNQHRLGPTRTVQSGEVAQREIELGMVVVGGLSFFFGIWLVYAAVWDSSKIAFAGFMVLGVLSLAAAYCYTAGKRAYGYIGLGDLFVLVFFGPVPVMGTFFLNSGFLPLEIFLPAISIGFFSSGVLNLNNMRDMENDRNSGKYTLPVRMGLGKSRVYHCLLIIGGWIMTCFFTAIHLQSYWQWLFAATLPLFLMDLIRVHLINSASDLDPFLKRLAISTLAFTLLFCVGLLASHTVTSA